MLSARMLAWDQSGLAKPNEEVPLGAYRGSLVLLTGASGYIGGRLLKALENSGWPVRCLARRPDFLQPKVAPSTEVVKADCLERGSLPPAMAGVHTAYYLVHSMGSSGQFVQEDRQAAHNFAHAARESGINRIIYWVGWESMTKHYPHICEVVTRSQISCAVPAFPPSNFALRSSLVVGVSPLK